MSTIARPKSNAKPSTRRPAPRARAPKSTGPAPSLSPTALAIGAIMHAAELLAGLPHVARLLRALVAVLSRPADLDTLGTARAIERATAALEVHEEEVREEDGGPTMDHSAIVVGVADLAHAVERCRTSTDAPMQARTDTARAVLRALADMMTEPFEARAEEKRARLARLVAAEQPRPAVAAPPVAPAPAHDVPIGDLTVPKLDKATPAELLAFALPSWGDDACTGLLRGLDADLVALEIAVAETEEPPTSATIRVLFEQARGRAMVACELHKRTAEALRLATTAKAVAS